jgi:hypothetical protein
MTRPKSTCDLRDSEREFIRAMQQLGFGRVELLEIRSGEVVLDPWPAMIRSVKLGTEERALNTASGEFELKRCVVDLFDYVRSVKVGRIRRLEIQHGLPLRMEVEHGSGGPHLG